MMREYSRRRAQKLARIAVLACVVSAGAAIAEITVVSTASQADTTTTDNITKGNRGHTIYAGPLWTIIFEPKQAPDLFPKECEK